MQANPDNSQDFGFILPAGRLLSRPKIPGFVKSPRSVNDNPEYLAMKLMEIKIYDFTRKKI
jgi:hypothetical protein